MPEIEPGDGKTQGNPPMPAMPDWRWLIARESGRDDLMSRRLAAILLLFLTALNLSHAAFPLAPQFISANKQYSVELSRIPENKILVAVFDISKEAKTLHWSRQIEWQELHPFANGPIVHEIKALVTNDGSTVVLRDYQGSEAKNGIRIMRQGAEDDRVVRPFDRNDLTGVKPPESFPPEKRHVREMRWGTSYLSLSALVDFIVDDENSYALWFGQTDQWLLTSLKDGKESLVQDATMLARLNSLARAKAEELILEHQPPPLRKMLSAIKDLATFVSSGQRPFYHSYLPGDTAAAYLFLTTRRDNAARQYIDGLLNYPSPGTGHGHPMLDEGLRIDCLVTFSERLIGDFLLSRWSGETNREALPRETYLLLPQDSFRHLGTIKVDFKLPMPLPSTNAGILWTYAIPARLSSDKWPKSDEVLAFNTHLSQLGHMRLPRSNSFGPEGTMIIRGLTPGDYRIKLIWERNPPVRTWHTNSYTAISGDYESVETKPITVKAGEIVENIPLACTNRLGSPTVYEADDRWAKERSLSRRKPGSSD